MSRGETVSERGSVLLVIVVSLVLFGMLGAGMVTLMTGSLMSGVEVQELAQARYLAESGLSVARSRFVHRTSQQLLTEVLALHRQKTVSIPDLGEVDLTCVPHWFHTGKHPTGEPAAGGSLVQGEGVFAAQGLDGSTRLLSGTPPEDADVYLVSLLDRTQSRLVSTGVGRWRLTVVPLSDVAFPEQDGLIGLVDDDGIISPDKRCYYRRLRRTATSWVFEEVRPVGHADGDPLPAARFLLHQTDLADKDLVLGQYVAITAFARTAGRGRDSLRAGFNGLASFHPTLSEPGAAFPGHGERVSCVVSDWTDVRLSVALAPAASVPSLRGLLFRTAFIGGEVLTDAGGIGLGLGTLTGSVALAKSGDGFSVVPSLETTINPLLLPGFVPLPAVRSDKENVPHAFTISKPDWDRYRVLYQNPDATTGCKRLKPLVVLWGYDDRPGAAHPLFWLAVGEVPTDTVPAFADTFRLLVRVQEEQGANHIRAWVAGGRASAPVRWAFVNAPFATLLSPAHVATSCAVGVPFTRTGFFQGVYRTDGTLPA
ncbi:MAG: hypothetical protein RRY20_02200, partial [Bilophila sp.]